MFEILHHGAVNGVTGSCHELIIDAQNSLLIDCGLFQGAESSPKGASSQQQDIDFDLSCTRALIVTHVHIDHVGRIPYLLAAGFDGPIFCSEPSAKLLPLVIEDALKVGATRNLNLIEAYLERLTQQVVAIPYHSWHEITLSEENDTRTQVRLSPAGHILGSAYVTVRVHNPPEISFSDQNRKSRDIVFSGDLGAPYAPLLSAPKSPYRADQLVLKSTYGDNNHEDRAHRRQRLQHSMERALADGGVVLIPAFSIGRTQELLYEIESIIHHNSHKEISHTAYGQSVSWAELDIIVDSPLASQFTDVYRELKPFWDKEAKQLVARGRHPLSFEQITTIDSHELHQQTVTYLARQQRPAVVIAASGMCAGGRIVNYLKALLHNPKNDVIFVGYQANGTPGREILNYADDENGYVYLDNERYYIRAQVWQVGGYSAHAGQKDLLNFVKRMRHKPQQIRLIHGEERAKYCLADKLKGMLPKTTIIY